MNDFDALIVGFGPTGATLASLLARAGLSVAVIDKEADVFDKPRAIGIDHESLRTLQSCGLSEELASIISLYKGGLYLGVDGEPIRSFVPISPPYPLAWPPNASFVQPELERAMRRKAAERPNVSVSLSSELVGIEQISKDRFALSVRRSNSEETYSAKYLLGCDGASSFVRRHVGTGFEDLNFDEWWVVVDAWVNDLDAVPVSSRQYCLPSRPVTYVVGPRNLRRWEFKLLPGESAQDFSSWDDVSRVLEKHVNTRALDVWRVAPYRFHALVAHRWRSGNAFLVGDAAHQTPPFLGQGMNSGIRDAANLAWKIELVERHGASPALLDFYAIERKPHFRSVVRTAKELGLIIGELDLDRALARDAELRALAATGKLSTTRHSYVPNLSAGLIDISDREAAATAGALFPQPWVRTDADAVRLDDLTGTRFVLVLSESAQLDWIADHERAMLAALNARVVLLNGAHGPVKASSSDWVMRVEEADQVLADWSRQHGAGAFLVRPDHYLYGAARSGKSLRAMIERLHDAIYASFERVAASSEP